MEHTIQHRISWRPAEVAMLTGLSLRHIAAAIARKELRSVRVGRARIIKDQDLRNWIDGHDAEVGQQPQTAAAR